MKQKLAENMQKKVKSKKHKYLLKIETSNKQIQRKLL